MNLNYEIIKVLWRSKSTAVPFISFYIIPKIKFSHFVNNPEDLKLSVDATEIYCVAESEYKQDMANHNQQIVSFSEKISSRFNNDETSNRKAKELQTNPTTDNTGYSSAPSSPKQIQDKAGLDFGVSLSTPTPTFALSPVSSESELFISPVRAIKRSNSASELSITPVRRSIKRSNSASEFVSPKKSAKKRSNKHSKLKL